MTDTGAPPPTPSGPNRPGGAQDPGTAAQGDAAQPVPRWRAPGTAGAALTHRRFRAVFLGSMASNTGSWMQNVTLAAWTFTITGSETFVSLVVFAQLGPLLLFTIVGGSLADIFDRRRLLLVVAIQQAAFALVLAMLALQDNPSRIGILACVLAIGIGQAINAPTFSSLLPTLVPMRDLPGAVSLQSVSLNASRVIGPAIGGVVLGLSGPSAVFVINAVSFTAIIGVLVVLRFPPVEFEPGEVRGLRRVLSGFTIARNNPAVGRSLVIMAAFSFFCLPFVTQFPAVAERNLGIVAESASYGALYAVFAAGSLLGALAVGTVLARRDLTRVVPVGLASFAGGLGVLALLRTPGWAFLVVFVVGASYFMAVTSLSTVMQRHITSAQRGRVMALWIMAFGGTVPVGGLVFGPLMELTSVTAVMLGGAVVAAVLAAVVVVRPPRSPEHDLTPAAGT